jgi:hypothetical protein
MSDMSPLSALKRTSAGRTKLMGSRPSKDSRERLVPRSGGAGNRKRLKH